MSSTPDWTDPCAVLAWLRPQYYAVASGTAEVEIDYAGRRTKYSMASITRLDALMRELESACARKQGVTTGRRRAFTAG
jgi:hypothetical protein